MGKKLREYTAEEQAYIAKMFDDSYTESFKVKEDLFVNGNVLIKKGSVVEITPPKGNK